MNQDGSSEFIYDEFSTPLRAIDMLLVRLMIGKVERRDRLVSILRSVPIRQDEEGWNCVGWVKEALESLRADESAMGKSTLEWQAVRDGVMDYVEKKKAEHRFDGLGSFDMSKVATYDMLEGRETIE